MAEIIFILGGARSGKSTYVLRLAKRKGKKVVFIATCQAMDKEMARRINLHKKIRPKDWQTFEEPRNVANLLNKVGAEFQVIIIDCITLLVSNLMLKNQKEDAVIKEINSILSALKKIKGRAFIVSNEVGLGIVPQNKLGRDFRNIAGKINQLIARESNKVFFMISGIPWKIK